MGRKKLGNKTISINLEIALVGKINHFADKYGLLKSRFVERLIMDCQPDFKSMDPLFYGKNRQRRLVCFALPSGCNEKFQSMRLKYGVTKEVLLAALMANFEVEETMLVANFEAEENNDSKKSDSISVGLELGLIDKINHYSEKEGLLKSRFVEKLIMDCQPDFKSMDPLFYGKNRQRKMICVSLPDETKERFQSMRLKHGVTKEVLIAGLMADYERKLDDFLVAEAMIELEGNGTK